MTSVQAAVNNYYADPTNRGATQVGDGATPSITGANGTGFFIDFSKLVGAGNYLNAGPALASSDHTGGTGSYTYYVKTDGTVESKWIGDRTTVGPKSGIYP